MISFKNFQTILWYKLIVCFLLLCRVLYWLKIYSRWHMHVCVTCVSLVLLTFDEPSGLSISDYSCSLDFWLFMCVTGSLDFWRVMCHWVFGLLMSHRQESSDPACHWASWLLKSHVTYECYKFFESRTLIHRNAMRQILTSWRMRQILRMRHILRITNFTNATNSSNHELWYIGMHHVAQK